MKIPKEINTYCDKCHKHTKHIVKKIVYKKSPAKARSVAWGQKKHIEKTKGYTSQLAGKKKVIKQRHKSVAVLECSVCHKKVQRPITDGKKAVEIKRQ